MLEDHMDQAGLSRRSYGLLAQWIKDVTIDAASWFASGIW